MGYDDYSYQQVYATWQAELREQAATDALARRIRRERRREQRDHRRLVSVSRRYSDVLR